MLSLTVLSGCQSAMNYALHDRSERVREFIDTRIASNDVPGIQYVVVTAESTLFSYSGGWADISVQRCVEPSTTMMMYSMTKTFTAAAVLQLVEQGLMSLDDPLAKYVPDTPYGNRITIRHLLCQTTGIPNPIPLSWVHLAEEHSQYDEQDALRNVMDENAELDFAPGVKFAYSNISYWLLGRVIEQASGSSYENHVRRNIFARLNLPQQEIDFVIPNRFTHAKGYLPKWSFMNLIKSFLIESKYVGGYENGWLHVNDHYLNGPAFGGIVATARSVGVFLQDQLSDSSRLFCSETKKFFFEQQRNNDGELIEMTLGWNIGELDGMRYFYKEGGGGGFRCEMRIYPFPGIGTVAIANSATFSAKRFMNEVDKQFFRQ
jgi:CubicO group peptidase (beta-lactamase class C family)